MPRPVALLDVDHTLLFADRLNQELLNALKRKNITDFYLFTDMTFKLSSMEDRSSLIEKLQNQGFIVHAVLTPNDLTWESINATETKKLYEWCNNNTFSGKLYGEEFEKFIQAHENELPSLVRAIKEYLPNNNTPGIGYKDAIAEYNTHHLVSENLAMRSYIAKAFADHLGIKCNYRHNKGLLLDLFLRHKPDWISSIIVADDNNNVISSIENFVPVDNSIAIPLITMLPVRGEKMGETYYDEKLQIHLDQDSIATAVTKIDTHIKGLESTWNPFKSTEIAATKIDALNLLKDALLQKTDGQSVGDIIDAWSSSIRYEHNETKKQVSVAEIISQHRNIFLGERRTLETSTEIFIRSLKNDFSVINEAEPLENADDLPPLAIEYVVFDWDDTLSNSEELGSEDRTLAFPDETVTLFKTLSQFGIKIIISSRQTSSHSIKLCLENNKILDMVSIIEGREQGKESPDKIKTLQAIECASKKHVYLVDDSGSTCKEAVKQGFSSIQVRDVDCSHVLSAKHLEAVHDVLNSALKTYIGDFSNRALEALEAYKEARPKTLNIFSRLFDSTRGARRANIYSRLISGNLNSEFDNMVYLYALFTSNDGKNIQKYVYKNLGLENIEQAKKYFGDKIQKNLSTLYPIKEDYEAVLNKLHSEVIARLVEFANSDQDFDANKVSPIHQALSEITTGTALLESPEKSSILSDSLR